MEDNGDDAEKYDSLFEQLQDILACGPVCQEKKIEDNLREKYNDAQINLLSGQSNLDDAEKNFILYTQGDAAYDKLYEDRLIAEADQNANEFKAIQEQRSKYIHNDLIGLNTSTKRSFSSEFRPNLINLLVSIEKSFLFFSSTG